MKPVASGHVDVLSVGPDGTARPVSSGRNTVSYMCADAMARLFVGDGTARPRTVVFVHGDDGLGGSFHFSPGDRDKGQADIVGGSLSVHEVPVADNPKRTASGPDYTGNVVTFGATSTAELGETTVYGLLLKAVDGTVLAVRKFDTAVSKADGYALSVSWSITFS